MSWKRIIKMARRIQAPVIISDESGKKPMVLLSFNDYEQLLNDEEWNVDKEIEGFQDEVFDLDESFFKASEPDARAEGAFEVLDEDDFEEEMPEISENFLEEAAEEPVKNKIESKAESSEIPLEDRFYFEPVEDEPQK